VLYFESYVVTEPGLTSLAERQILSEEEYLDAQAEFGEDSFTAGIGAEAVREMLINLDLEAEVERTRFDMTETTSSSVTRSVCFKNLLMPSLTMAVVAA